MRRLLSPLTAVYRLALAAREIRLRRGWEPVRRLQFPVISIGNLSTGGAGKTPFAIALARALGARGVRVDVLSRGYGRRSAAAARVLMDGTPREFGDEPLLIARDAGVPVYVARQRYEAGWLAERDAPHQPSLLRVHILDDGFQHRQLHRDVDILLVNPEDWHGRLLPAGNLREPVRAAGRANVIAVPHNETELESQLCAGGWQGPVWRLNRRMEVPPVAGPVVAFCGIARPEQFFRGLEEAGLQLAQRIAFPDHHRYTARDLERLGAAAKVSGTSVFVTTPKDEVRLRVAEGGVGVDKRAHPNPWLPTLSANDVQRMGPGSSKAGLENARFFTAGLTVEIEDEAAALDWLIARVKVAGPPIRPL